MRNDSAKRKTIIRFSRIPTRDQCSERRRCFVSAPSSHRAGAIKAVSLLHRLHRSDRFSPGDARPRRLLSLHTCDITTDATDARDAPALKVRHLAGLGALTPESEPCDHLFELTFEDHLRSRPRCSAAHFYPLSGPRRCFKDPHDPDS